MAYSGYTGTLANEFFTGDAMLDTAEIMGYILEKYLTFNAAKDPIPMQPSLLITVCHYCSYI